MRKWIIGGMLAALVVATAACNVVVTPTATNGWFFLTEGANGSGVYMNGPGVPPAGRGSALLTVDGAGQQGIATVALAGTALAGFDQLNYATYQASGSPDDAPNLEFDVDYDSKDNSTAYQGRLVFAPAVNGTVTIGAWNTWTTMNGPGAWYSSASGSSSFRPIVGGNAQASPPCTQASFCTWAAVNAAYPNARIRPTSGLFMVRIGGNTHAGSAAVDNVVIGAGGQALVYNFEPGDGHIAVNSTNAASLGFGFANEGGSGSGSFISGPNGTDGAGSAQLKLTGTSDGEALATGVFAGTQFKDLTFLSYKTYQQAAGTNATTLQFDADYDSTDASTAFQGRVVFEPSASQGAPITADTWQTWNPLTATSGWRQTGTPIVNGEAGAQICTLAIPCSYQQLITTYPNLRISPVTGQNAGKPIGGGIWLKAGSGWTAFTGDVDSLTIGVKAGTTNGTVTYDFEG